MKSSIAETGVGCSMSPAFGAGGLGLLLELTVKSTSSLSPSGVSTVTPCAALSRPEGMRMVTRVSDHASGSATLVPTWTTDVPCEAPRFAPIILTMVPSGPVFGSSTESSGAFAFFPHPAASVSTSTARTHSAITAVHLLPLMAASFTRCRPRIISCRLWTSPLFQPARRNAGRLAKVNSPSIRGRRSSRHS